MNVLVAPLTGADRAGLVSERSCIGLELVTTTRTLHGKFDSKRRCPFVNLGWAFYFSVS